MAISALGLGLSVAAAAFSALRQTKTSFGFNTLATIALSVKNTLYPSNWGAFSLVIFHLLIVIVFIAEERLVRLIDLTWPTSAVIVCVSGVDFIHSLK